jgi:hypothetical protein
MSGFCRWPGCWGEAKPGVPLCREHLETGPSKTRLAIFEAFRPMPEDRMVMKSLDHALRKALAESEAQRLSRANAKP